MHNTRDALTRRRVYLLVLLAAVVVALLPAPHPTPEQARATLRAMGEALTTAGARLTHPQQ